MKQYRIELTTGVPEYLQTCTSKRRKKRVNKYPEYIIEEIKKDDY